MWWLMKRRLKKSFKGIMFDRLDHEWLNFSNRAHPAHDSQHQGYMLF